MQVRIGNIFDSKATTLVNTINCVGVMGKGIALEFKKRYPAMFDEYVELCGKGMVKPGKPYYYADLCGTSIINFPTKDNWRSPSRLSYIVDGLNWFRENYQELGITSIAFPPLGCGNGGLEWSVVGPLMYSKLVDLPIKVEIYAPYGTSPEQLTEQYLKANLIHSPKELIGNKNVSFNKYWLLILYTVQRLNSSKYSLSVGRTIFQKVCYVLTRTGIPTGFHFVEGTYGPYAKEVKQAITVLSNANLMSEIVCGKMVKTVVPSSFKLPENEFSENDMKNVNTAIDLLGRIKSTEHAEMIATVLFSYDELSEKNQKVADSEVLSHVLAWKPRWKEAKEKEICTTISYLSYLHWITPVYTGTLLHQDEIA